MMMDSGSREAWAKAALLVDEGARGRRRHIVGAAAQLLFLDARQGAAQVDADFGIGAAETVDYPEGAQLPRAGHADADRPCLSVGDGGCVLVGSPQRVQHVGHVAVVLPPGRRQLHPLGAAREQREAQLFLERLDLLADRRLRHVASLRRLGEAQRVGHGDKVLKLRRAHGGPFVGCTSQHTRCGVRDARFPPMPVAETSSASSFPDLGDGISPGQLGALRAVSQLTLGRGYVFRFELGRIPGSER